MDVKGAGYGFLYAIFGLGATVGAWSVGTILAGRPRRHTVRASLAGFAVALVVFGLLRDPIPAYPVVFLVGLTYFLTITSLSTMLQQHLEDEVRGRVMSLWIMGFGGTVPIGLLVAGALTAWISMSQLVVAGGLIALVLAIVARLNEDRTGPGTVQAAR